jgi:MoaA/NifB/PqqE/SkfB family radical SAM enzyme
MIVSGWRFRVIVARLWWRAAATALRTHGARNSWSALRRLQGMVTATRSGHRLRKVVRVGSRHTFDIYTPAFPSRAAQRFLEQEIRRNVDGARGNRVQTAIVAITKECPLRCEHCCEWENLNGPETLTKDDLRKIVGQLRARGVTQIFFTGGEPLRRVPDLLYACDSAGEEIDCWIITSGVGLTASVASAVRVARFTGVVVSVDHWNRELHDKFRGRRGAFDAAISAAARAKEVGLAVAFSVCPTRDFATREHLERYAALAAEAGASFIQIMEPRKVGHYADRDVLLGPSELQALEAFSDSMNFSNANAHGPIVTYPALYQRRYGCFGAAERYLYIDTNGDAHACPFCRHAAANVVRDGVNPAIDALQARGCPAAAAAPRITGSVPAVASLCSAEAMDSAVSVASS